MSNQNTNCPKCGGTMKSGDFRIDIPPSTSSMNPMSPMSSFGTTQIGQPATVYPYWEEKTGKKGFLGRESTAIMNIKTYRCSVCGYIEFYVKE
ncbi:hypothetical protein JW865_07745 [Candidatus Bathyarchaeota archaeon]|nr:hypothetical protein [Candidatus Bathyarchaeota archaeon]